MPARIRSTLAALAALLMLATSSVPAAAYTEEDSASTPVVFDSIFLRPLGIVTFLFGSALFVAGLPILAITRPTDIATPWRSLVVNPARYVWVDPIGEH
jgi:hypothetical protein